jgi:oligopeptide/dipeptide ABC transporter ATP-binding protein
MPNVDNVIEIKDLRVEFPTEDGLAVAVDGLSLAIGRGRIVGLVGESGCGKSVTGLAVLRLLQPPGRIASGSILFKPQPDAESINLTELLPDSEQLRKIRGAGISVIFQEPMSSLTPVYTIGDQIAEAILTHKQISKREARAQAVELLRSVGVPSPELRADDYPHQLSGGMRQRALIAMALSCNPKLLIADEPTTALDVTVQAQILELLLELRESAGLSILLITHDMGVVADSADDVVVMYAGVVVESAPVLSLFKNPLHPYTRGLLLSIPSAGARAGRKLYAVEGTVPDWRSRPIGCLFEPRCTERIERCKIERPSLRSYGDGHFAACWVREAELGGTYGG